DEASDSGEALLSEPEQAAVANSVPAARAAARTRAGRTSGRGVVTCASCGTDGPPGADAHRARLLPPASHRTTARPGRPAQRRHTGEGTGNTGPWPRPEAHPERRPRQPQRAPPPRRPHGNTVTF